MNIYITSAIQEKVSVIAPKSDKSPNTVQLSGLLECSSSCERNPITDIFWAVTPKKTRTTHIVKSENGRWI